MWFFTRPSDEAIRAFLIAQACLPYSYPNAGASAGDAPAGYVLDHNRVQLGSGKAVFDAACAALRRWQQFPAPWTEIHPATAPLEPGNNVAILARVFGLWWLNAARIVNRIDESSPVRYFGFAYGTLPGHAESGEERFRVEWHADDSVWYDLLAFSRPRYWLVRLAYPLTRRLQKRFAKESMEAMSRFANDLGACS